MTVAKAKPVGPVPAGFRSRNGVLLIGDREVTDLAEQAGRTPFFVYSKRMMDDRALALRSVLPDRIKLNYAIKANSFFPVLEHMSNLVDGLDIASGGELEQVRAVGYDMDRVSFAGPGKRDSELELAIAQGVTLNCESEGEAERALAIAARIDRTPRLAVRVNPDFDLKGSGMKMGGGAKPFGIDAERVPALVRRVVSSGAQWRGFHIFTGSQSLDEDSLIETQGRVIELADRLARDVGRSCPKLNMGGGFGIPYFHGDEPLDIAKIGASLAERVRSLPATLEGADLMIELGRYLVGEAGVYVTRILDRKESYGETYLVTDGGLHHQLAASGNFGTVVRRNYPVVVANRMDEAETEIANIVGCLCTPLDRLADRAAIPPARVGDLIAVFCAGAYGASASPSAFLGQGPAIELFV